MKNILQMVMNSTGDALYHMISVILSFSLVICSLFVPEGKIARAEDSVSFILYEENADGTITKTTSGTTEYGTPMPTTDGNVIFEDNYYVLTRGEDGNPIEMGANVVINGEVKFILCDGADWKFTKGIQVNTGAHLSIYAQSERECDGMGKLTVDASSRDATAGISINKEESGNPGKLTIHGGEITVTGGKGAAGIGGDQGKANGKITIHGGDVTSTALSGNTGQGGAGIGSGEGNNEYDGEEIKITGGIVNAETIKEDGSTGNSNGAGIGSGADGGKTVPVTIKGGKITAKSYGKGAGIGGGHMNAGGDITISGGIVEATAGQQDVDGGGAGIGGGVNGASGTIKISGGNVTAISPNNGAGIGSGLSGKITDIQISGGIIHAESYGQGAGIGGGACCTADNSSQITITGGIITAKCNDNSMASDIGCGDNSSNDAVDYFPYTGIVNGNVCGNVTLDESLAKWLPDSGSFDFDSLCIPGMDSDSPATLTVAKGINIGYNGEVLSVEEGSTLNLQGTLSYYGGLLIEGAGEIKHELSLNNDGGSSSPSTITATYGRSLPTLTTKPTKNGYQFEGYFRTFSVNNDTEEVQYYDADGKSTLSELPEASESAEFEALREKHMRLLAIDTLSAKWKEGNSDGGNSGEGNSDEGNSDNNPSNSSSVSYYDSSSYNAPEKTTEEHSNGTKTVTSTYPDGSSVEEILDENGNVLQTTRRSVSTDAGTGEKTTTVIVEQNGKTETTVTYEKADGSKEITITTKNADGTTEETVKKEYADGTKEMTVTKEKSNGEKEITTSTEKKDGENVVVKETFDKDGKSISKVTTETKTDAVSGKKTTVETTETTGGHKVVSTSEERTDGSREITVMETRADGSTSTKKESIAPDGTVIERKTTEIHVDKETGNTIKTESTEYSGGTKETVVTKESQNGEKEIAVTKENTDGTIEKILTTEYLDGSSIVKKETIDHSTGKVLEKTTIEVKPALEPGTKVTTQTKENKDGTVEVAVTKEKTDGSKETTLTKTDGKGGKEVTTTKENSDKSREETVRKENSDGSSQSEKKIIDKNGVVTETVNSETKIEKKTGNTVTSESTKRVDGSSEQSITTEKKNGDKDFHSEKRDSAGKTEFYEKQETKTTIKESLVSKDENGNVTEMKIHEQTESGETTIPFVLQRDGSVSVEQVKTTEETVTIQDSVKMPDGKTYDVKKVEDNAMKNNQSVEDVTVESGIEEIGNSAFQNCKNLTKLTLNEGLKSLGKNSCQNIGVKNVTVPSSVRKMGKGCFRNCKNLKKLTIGKKKKGGLQSLDGKVAWGAAIQISIGASALENCIRLKEVIINSQVTEIGNDAFRKCKALAKIVVYSLVLKMVGKRALTGVSNCKINVPKVKIKSYKILFKNKGQGKKVVVAKM